MPTLPHKSESTRGLLVSNPLDEELVNRAGATRVLSVNVGQRRSVEIAGKSVESGIYKYPVEGTRRIEREGIVGDERVDPRKLGEHHHAVYAYPHEHYAYWQQRYDIELELGQFGENLTVTGLLETEVRIGDLLRVGDALLQVGHPRIPCRKLNHRMGFRFSRTFLESRRTGYYLRVLELGDVASGSRIELLDSDGRSPTVDEFVRVAQFEYWDVQGLERLLTARDLVPGWREIIGDKLERARRASGWIGLREFCVVERQETKDTLSLRIRCARGRALPAFAPGQHLPVSLGENARDRVLGHAYALSSNPLELDTYRITARGEASSVPNTPYAFAASRLPIGLVPGARFLAGAPRGFSVLSDASFERAGLLFLTENVAVAPVVSMLHYWAGKQHKVPAVLIHHDESGTLASFDEEVRAIAANGALDVRIRGASFDAASLHHVLTRHHLVDVEVFVSGSQAFVDAARDALSREGVSTEAVHLLLFMT